MIALLLTLACAGPSPGLDNSGSATSTATPTTGGGGSSTSADAGSTDAGSTTAGQLYGEVPDTALPAPEFVATNRDDTGRSREDLLGHPTVMWFYPAAGTAG